MIVRQNQALGVNDRVIIQRAKQEIFKISRLSSVTCSSSVACLKIILPRFVCGLIWKKMTNKIIHSLACVIGQEPFACSSVYYVSRISLSVYFMGSIVCRSLRNPTVFEMFVAYGKVNTEISACAVLPPIRYFIVKRTCNSHPIAKKLCSRSVTVYTVKPLRRVLHSSFKLRR